MREFQCIKLHSQCQHTLTRSRKTRLFNPNSFVVASDISAVGHRTLSVVLISYYVQHPCFIVLYIAFSLESFSL